jgi:uncharacterized SAM-binding protein YcdF (DUF218 family)
MNKLLELFIPGSLSFLFITLIIVFLLLYNRKLNSRGKLLYGIILFSYLIFSIPKSASWLALPLTHDYISIPDSKSGKNARAIVLLDAGAAQLSEGEIRISFPNKTAALRLLETIRVYQLLDSPVVIVSAGDSNLKSGMRSNAFILKEQLMKNGVPVNRIVVDSLSKNTRDHGLNVSKILKNRDIKEFILVTSPSHMYRSLRSFQKEGMHPIASISRGDLDHIRDWKVYIPSTDALEFTQGTIHEYFGILFYYLRSYI